MPNEVQNYDESRKGNWYCELDSNPDGGMSALAIKFMAWVATPLLTRPPEIHWFKKAEASEARQGWKRMHWQQTNNL